MHHCMHWTNNGDLKYQVGIGRYLVVIIELTIKIVIPNVKQYLTHLDLFVSCLEINKH